MKFLRAGFFFCLFALFAVHGHAAAAGTLTVATYNVENYNATDRRTEAGYRPDYPKPEAQKTALRAVIRRINADVLALQEMGGPPYLEELRRDLKGEGLEYPFGTVLEAEDKERHVAVLSKRPLTAVVRHTDLVAKFAGTQEKVRRGLLEVRLATGSGEWTLFIVHLKSRLTERDEDPDSAAQRAGEAEAVRDRVLKICPDPATAKFLLLGDCNAGRTERPLRALMTRGKTEIAEWLPAADSRGEVWSYFYTKTDTYDRVDHILVSAGLRPAVASTRIEDGPGVKEASDHRPVVVTLRTE